MNKENEPSVYFKKLTESEKQSKLARLCTVNDSSVVVWLKGSKNKYTLKPSQFYKSKKEILITGDVPDNLFNKEVLVSFELSGLHFFGQSKLITQTSDKLYLDFNLVDLFKSERRANFRLLTFPHQKVYLHIKVPSEEVEQSNIVQFNTKTSETGLFTNFLSLIGEKNSIKKIEGYIKLRVLDISVTGLALRLGDIENKFLEKIGPKFTEMYLEFNENMIAIPEGEILYKLDFLAPDRKTRMFKGGLKFSNIDTNLDEELSKIINETLRSLDSEFEDFLK